MSPDEKALLETIWESPLDDAPRLVYADWLQETNIPENIARAEFIRVQCELAQLDRWTKRYKELKAKADQLLPEFDPNSKLIVSLKHPSQAHYIRGFRELQTTNRNRNVFLRIQDAYWEAPTWNVGLNFEETWGSLKEYRQFFYRIRRLALFHSKIEAERWEVPAKFLRSNSETILDALGCPEWKNLTHLLLDLPLDETTIIALLGCPHLERLETFFMSVDQCSASALHSLMNSGKFLKLRQLQIEREDTDRCSLAFLRSAQFPSLKSLDLYGHQLTENDIDHLCECELLNQLQELWLQETMPSLASFERLANCSSLKGLKFLDIGDTDPELRGIKKILESPYFRNLESFSTSVRTTEQHKLAESWFRPRFGDNYSIYTSLANR
jgi:uncharacterized protein (TIGR02996 family)